VDRTNNEYYFVKWVLSYSDFVSVAFNFLRKNRENAETQRTQR
jgi:hypothetical protein